MSFLYVKIICYKNVSYFQPIFLIPAKTDYIIGCKSDTNIDAQMQEGNEPDVVASRCENNVYDLTVAANCDAIKDTEAFAEKVVQKYEENSFRTTKFSVDLGEDIDLVRFHVYLRREEIGEKEELFQIRYQDGDIILDGINGKR